MYVVDANCSRCSLVALDKEGRIPCPRREFREEHLPKGDLWHNACPLYRGPSPSVAAKRERRTRENLYHLDQVSLW
jgi:hypothetical protein